MPFWSTHKVRNILEKAFSQNLIPNHGELTIILDLTDTEITLQIQFFPFKIMYEVFKIKNCFFSPQNYFFLLNFAKWNLVNSKSCWLKVPSEYRNKLWGGRYKTYFFRFSAPCNFPPLIFFWFSEGTFSKQLFDLPCFICWSLKKIVLGVK